MQVYFPILALELLPSDKNVVLHKHMCKNTPGIRTLLVTLAATTLPSAHVQRALPVYISAILFKLAK